METVGRPLFREQFPLYKMYANAATTQPLMTKEQKYEDHNRDYIPITTYNECNYLPSRPAKDHMQQKKHNNMK